MVHLQGYDGRRAGDERVSMRKEERNKWNVQGYAGLCRSSLQAYSGISLNLCQTLMTVDIEITWRILDPGNANVYASSIWLIDSYTLKVRGYLEPFYRSQVWKVSIGIPVKSS